MRTTELYVLPNPEALVKQLSFFIQAAQKANPSELSEIDIQKLICHSISVLIDASVQHKGFWDATKKHAHFDELIFSLLLEEKRQLIRRQVAEKIRIICAPSSSQKLPTNMDSSNTDEPTDSKDSTVADIISTVWNAFLQNMRNTVKFAKQSEEYFTAALSVFRSVAERSLPDAVLTEYVSQWSESMLSHKTEEVCPLSCLGGAS